MFELVSFSINPTVGPTEGASRPRSPRRRVLLTGQFQSLTDTHRISVRNLSSTGAAICCDLPLKLGSEGVLVAGGLDCLCKVVWHRAGTYGLKFEEPLHSSVVNDLHKVTREQIQAAEKDATRRWYYNQAR